MTAIFALLVLGLNPQSDGLLGADEFLKRLKSARVEAPSDTFYEDSSYAKRSEVLKLIGAYGKDMPALTPSVAAERWLTLLDQALMAGIEISQVAFVLPPPEAWPMIQNGIESRMASRTTVRAAAIRLLGASLTSDPVKYEDALRAAWTIVDRLPRQEREGILGTLNRVGLDWAVFSRNRDSLKKCLTRAASSPESDIRLDDEVVNLLGSEAEVFLAYLLRKATGQVSTWCVQPKNVAVVDRVALQTVREHRVAQWGLAAKVGNITLYEAINDRFGKTPSKQVKAYGYAPADMRQEAFSMYLLSLAKAGQADRALRLAGTSKVTLTSPLGKFEFDPKMSDFARRLLIKSPKSDLWRFYEMQATRLGRFDEMLATADTGLELKGLSVAEQLPMMKVRESALLAMDRVEEARKALKSRATLELKHKKSDHDGATVRLSTLESALKGQSLSAGTPSTSSESPAKREARLLDQATYRWGDDLADSTLSLYYWAKRYEDVVKFLDADGFWSSADLADADTTARYRSRAPLDNWLAAKAAKSLAHVGRTSEAIRIAMEVAKADLGNDRVYELLLACNPADPIAELDTLAALNAYEERPLIWKAKVLLDRGELDAAETAIKAAIKIDPSDGEQQDGRRMYAYTVYGDILEKKGDVDQARVMRNAVRAVRMAERADLLLEAGLIKRANQTYAQALTIFADAYCIQSRLAINLYESGRTKEAIEHYRKAYELMADSFGYVETHCFGCEAAFSGELQQQLAEEVFIKIAADQPTKPQIHYLMGYLREEQGRTEEAIGHYRRAVELDDRYLNAWRRLVGVGPGRLSSEEMAAAHAQILRLEPRIVVSDELMYIGVPTGTLADQYRQVQARATKGEMFKLKSGAPPTELDVWTMYEMYMGGTSPGYAVLSSRPLMYLQRLLEGGGWLR